MLFFGEDLEKFIFFFFRFKKEENDLYGETLVPD